MKAIPTTIFIAALLSVSSFLSAPQEARAQGAPGRAQNASLQKRPFLDRSIGRRQSAQRPIVPGQRVEPAVPKAQSAAPAQAVGQAAPQQPAAPGRGVRRTVSDRPAASGPRVWREVPKRPAAPGARARAFPKGSGAQPRKGGFKLRLPKFGKPALARSGNGIRVHYPNGIRNPELGGAYGVIQGDRVKFYEFGPAQPRGPDEWLTQSSLVTIRSNDRAWAQVTLASGRSGYVALKQVRLANATEAARATAPPKPGLSPGSQMVAGNESKKRPPRTAADSTGAQEPEIKPSGRGATANKPRLGAGPADESQLPEPYFDPILDPLGPIPDGRASIPGDPEPFTSDRILSVEEELRAIQREKDRKEAKDSN